MREPQHLFIEANNNEVTYIPQGIEKAIALQNLMVSNNSISAWPDGIAKLSIFTLALDGNGIIDDCQPGVWISNLDSWLTSIWNMDTFQNEPVQPLVNENGYIDNCLGICQDGDPDDCVDNLDIYTIIEFMDEEGWYYLLPPILIIVVLMKGQSVPFAGVIGIASVIALGGLKGLVDFYGNTKAHDLNFQGFTKLLWRGVSTWCGRWNKVQYGLSRSVLPLVLWEL